MNTTLCLDLFLRNKWCSSRTCMV